MAVEVLIDKEGNIVAAQEPPARWGRMEDIEEYAAHFGSTEGWRDTFFILELADVTLEEVRAWQEPQALETKQVFDPLSGEFFEKATKLANNTKNIPLEKLEQTKDIDRATYDARRRVRARRDNVKDIVTDTRTGEVIGAGRVPRGR